MEFLNKEIQNIHRGEVYYFLSSSSVGSEQKGGRPCVIVSNEKNNEYAKTVTIIPITSKEKNPLPTHVKIDIGSIAGTALAEQIMTISVNRLSDYCGEIDLKTQKEVDKALAVQLALSPKNDTPPHTNIAPAPVPVRNIEKDAERDELFHMKVVESERDTYKELYNSLLEKLIETK